MHRVAERGGEVAPLRPVLMAARAAGEGTPVSAGEIEIAAAVEVVFALR